MGVVVRRYIDFLIILLIPTSLVLAPFLQQNSYFFVNFKMFLCSLDITDAQLLYVSGNEHINGTDYNI